jgi:hypothetical protein
MAILAVLFIVVPFLTWYLTWFGRPLSDSTIGEYLSDSKNPRHVQHALSQIVTRVERGDPSVKRLYPQIASLADHPVAEVRVTAAWVMGQDNTSNQFHQALSRLLQDSQPMVRRNAALGLVRFGDGSGRHELMMMMRPYNVPAPEEGTTAINLQQGKPVGQGTLLARIKLSNGEEREVRSPLPGEIGTILVRDGMRVEKGSELVVLRPEPDAVWEALRALYLVGRAEDLPDVDRYAEGGGNMPDHIRQQAVMTAKAIRGRIGQ